ncbi:unnamed protein product [Soboliphyme baturini]|uniref:Integrase catalytic domain-containing protein n=1 Tax=Soboliphyme baturini TaxID=241478 RepID=A0A183IHH4_9BILA|nr:unnamed protein product [Soboliphyme baturini]
MDTDEDGSELVSEEEAGKDRDNADVTVSQNEELTNVDENGRKLSPSHLSEQKENDRNAERRIAELQRENALLKDKVVEQRSADGARTTTTVQYIKYVYAFIDSCFDCKFCNILRSAGATQKRKRWFNKESIREYKIVQPNQNKAHQAEEAPHSRIDGAIMISMQWMYDTPDCASQCGYPVSKSKFAY